MAEGPFNHVVDCSSPDGVAIDWTLTPEEQEQIEIAHQKSVAEAVALERREAVRDMLLRRTQGDLEAVLTVADLRMLLECLGWLP